MNKKNATGTNFITPDFLNHIDILNAKHIIRFSKYVITFELILITMSLVSYFQNPVGDFMYFSYTAMYIFLSVCTLLVYFRSKKFLRLRSGDSYRKLINGFSLIFILWGLVISIMDQQLYGNLNAYYVNMAAVMALIYLSERTSTITFISSAIILFIALPFFQDNTDVLIGHYVNTTVFVVFMLVASRVHYQILLKQFHMRNHLKQTIIQNEEMEWKLRSAVEKLETLVLQDDLTHLPNRRGLESYIERLKQIEHEPGAIYSILMIDIDYFKDYNDFYGHVQGDDALVSIAKALSGEINSLSDYIIRFGGEEFLQISLDKSPEDILEKANAIRHKIETLNISHVKSKCSDVVTVSIGIAHGRLDDLDQFQDLVQKADQSLYKAKSLGRNQVSA